jgi:hypothetical protein
MVGFATSTGEAGPLASLPGVVRVAARPKDQAASRSGAPPRQRLRAAHRARQAWAQAGRTDRPRIVAARYPCLGPGAGDVADAYLEHPYGPEYAAAARADADDGRGAACRALALGPAGCDDALLFPCSGDIGQVALVGDALGAGPYRGTIRAPNLTVPSRRPAARSMTSVGPARGADAWRLGCTIRAVAPRGRLRGITR